MICFRIRAVAIALLVMWSPTSFAEPANDQDRLDPAWGIVLSPSNALALVNARSDQVAGLWIPSRYQIDQLELTLGLKLTEGLRTSQCPKADNLGANVTDHPARTADYYRQYAALYYLGKPTIFINGFHRSFVEQETKESTGQTCEIYCSDCNPPPVPFPCEPFAAKPNDFWQKEIVSVNDGGNYFFSAAYDVTTGTITSFFFNGSA